jgi:hypothetical protein
MTHKQIYNQFKYGYYIKVLSGAEYFIDPKTSLSYSILNNYLYCNPVDHYSHFMIGYFLEPLIQQIISNKNIALLNLQHNSGYIKLLASNIIRGVVFELEEINSWKK